MLFICSGEGANRGGDHISRLESQSTEVFEMDLKEVFEKLEKLENGAEMITAIKAETN